MYQLVITDNSRKTAVTVVTLLGVQKLIQDGNGPGIIDRMNLTRRAAAYWSDYKSTTFPKIKSYKLWDTIEKIYLSGAYSSFEVADSERDKFLQDGNYYNRPYNVVEVHEFSDNKFVGVI